MAVFSLAMAASLFSPKAEVLPIHTALANYPRDLGDWHGRDGQLTDQVLQILKPTDYLLTDYADGAFSANLYVAFYDSQRNAAPHSPEICIPGGGWEIVSLTLRDLDVPGVPKGAKIKRALIQHGEMRQIVYFWLVERGRVVTNDWAARWYLFVDPIRYGRTDGALIRAITPLARGEDEASGDARLTGILQLALPRLGEFIPLQPVDAAN
jgi:EpsI family protein